ncbi:ubiquinol-cytochrome-c oxidoreductase complex iii subunit 11kd protein of the family protein [Apiospora kogelbergensis]|uniref:ubiquinol-cytochrome-c oxidoreductase complex iii subunit 11kd protein of the family protein n=1 Tax=Apiospora kogelbergensis TaxID=1337665 RepID=UPI0031304792
MRPTQILHDEPPIRPPTGVATPERGIITYALSSNRQNLFAGAGHAAVFNTWRRFAGQVLFWAPPLVAAWYAMEWANKR